MKTFWTAEEVPRWIGFSLAALLVVGVTAVARHGTLVAERHYEKAINGAADRSIQLLVNLLADAGPSNPEESQRVLRTFARSHECEELRIVDPEGIVLASMFPAEIGEASSTTTIRSVPESASEHIERKSFRFAVRGNGSSSGGAPRFLEGVWVSRCDDPGGVFESSVAIMLAVFVLFLLVYRTMRLHFRGMSRISENLIARGDQIEQELDQLRIADHHDAVTGQWNRLIDLINDLSSNARRTTASEELRKALEQSRRGELADIVDVIPDGLLYFVDRETVAYANTVARRLFQVEAVAHERIKLQDMRGEATADNIIAKVNNAVRPDEGFAALTEIVESGDGDTTYRVRVLPFGSRQHRGQAVVLITDISQQVRADRAREEFVSQVTHELRTPLTNIRAYAETLSSGVFDDPKIITECYNVITKETRRLARLIEDILSMSQLEVGTIQLHMNDVELQSLMGDAVRDVRGIADEMKIDLQLSMPSKTPILRGDRDKLAVVINNLLGNALKYTPSGGSVRVGVQVNPDTVLLTVKDDGMGIAKEDHDRIFEKFQRGSSPEVGDIPGTGIGLTTAREIARRHRGDIEVMSEPGDGATFIVRLPLVGAGADAAPSKEPAIAAAGTE